VIIGGPATGDTRAAGRHDALGARAEILATTTETSGRRAARRRIGLTAAETAPEVRPAALERRAGVAPARPHAGGLVGARGVRTTTDDAGHPIHSRSLHTCPQLRAAARRTGLSACAARHRKGPDESKADRKSDDRFHVAPPSTPQIVMGSCFRVRSNIHSSRVNGSISASALSICTAV
jgi:hypothetical protein